MCYFVEDVEVFMSMSEEKKYHNILTNLFAAAVTSSCLALIFTAALIFNI